VGQRRLHRKSLWFDLGREEIWGARLRDDGLNNKKLSCFYTLERSSFVIVTYQVGCVDI